VDDAKTGLKLPLLKVRDDKVETFDIRVTVSVKVSVVIPFGAVTRIVMILDPTTRGIE
jgi:hypothetical protein